MADSAVVAVGDAVRLIARQPYLKSADPMPMLRPADLVSLDELGQVVALRSGSTVAVRFRRGTFLIDTSQLQGVQS